MKVPTSKILAVLLSAVFVGPAAASPELAADISSSSAAAREAPPFRFEFQKGQAPGSRPSVGVGAGIREGKPLQMALWGSGGAVIGSLAGPAGAIMGATAGAVAGLLVSLFTTPAQKFRPLSPEPTISPRK